MSISTPGKRDPNTPFNVLFLCSGNSARSIMAECAMRRYGLGRFVAFSAGSTPRGQVDPYAADLLKLLNYKVDGLRSKSWEEFIQPDSPHMDFIIIVCDQTAKTPFPNFPGAPMVTHWGIEDPVAFQGPEDKKRLAYRRAYFEAERRIKIFANLRLEGLEHLLLKNTLDDLGRTTFHHRDEEMATA